MKRSYVIVTQRYRIDHEKPKDLQEATKDIRDTFAAFSTTCSGYTWEPVGKAKVEKEEK